MLYREEATCQAERARPSTKATFNRHGHPLDPRAEVRGFRKVNGDREEVLNEIPNVRRAVQVLNSELEDALQARAAIPEGEDG